MHLVGDRVEVEHYRLLCKPVLGVDLSGYLVEALVDGLFDVQSWAIDTVHEALDIAQSSHSFLYFPIRPDLLDAKSCSSFHYRDHGLLF
jgi:hypothetical protein